MGARRGIETERVWDATIRITGYEIYTHTFQLEMRIVLIDSTSSGVRSQNSDRIDEHRA